MHYYVEPLEDEDYMNQHPVGRNDPCPCGSGAKYKACHWGLVEAGRRAEDHLHGSYKEPEDKVAEQGFSSDIPPGTDNCKTSAIVGECAEGHTWAMPLFCGREWCPECGTPGSEAHKRRVGRLVDKALQMKSMGLWVIEPLNRDRDRWKDPETQAEVRQVVKEWLRQWGYERGFGRWHFFGDPRCPDGCTEKAGFVKRSRPRELEDGSLLCPECGQIFDLADMDLPSNPHLNVVVDEGKLEKDQFKAMKYGLQHMLAEAGLVSLPPGGDDTNKVNVIARYRYKDTPPKMYHTLRYITRPTFRCWEWDKQWSIRLENSTKHNSFVWGTHYRNPKWNRDPVWSVEDLDGDGTDPEAADLRRSVCPECGTDIIWDSDCILSFSELQKRYRMDSVADGAFVRLYKWRTMNPVPAA